MADVTGPISTLPGSVRVPPKGATCDTEGHEHREASHRVQGETDSMGSEMHDMCEECYLVHVAAVKKMDGAAFMGLCNRCKSPEEQGLFPYRDWEEGQSGPLYYYCRSCRSEIFKREAELLDEEEDYRGYADC